MEFDKGNKELTQLLEEYYKKFSHPAYGDVEWDFHAFEVEEFMYYIKKCLETGINMSNYLDKHFGEWKHD